MTDNELLLGYATHDKAKGNGIFPVTLNLKRANRHGLIAGATGTGKTVTLQALAESFSRQGVPVFLTDVKGDVSGVSQAGKSHPKVNERLAALDLPAGQWRGCSTVFWDLYGKQGHPIRATVSDMGPLLLSRLMGLNETQEGVLNIAFAVADDNGLPLLDLKDLRAMLQHLVESAAEFKSLYGNISRNSVGAIQRRLLVLERGGAKKFFGEPMLELDDLMQVDGDGEGLVNVLVANRLINEPAVYSSLLLWLVSELFENLPEIGDPEKPKLVVFFDEAHLMFKDTPKALVDKIEQVVRLIRSKGVGIYFITQSPGDIPDSVLAQLANRVQHALRAFTPKEQKAVKVAAQTFRSDDSFSVQDAIGEMGVGEALVSTLMANGAPSFVRRTMIKPPVSRIGKSTRAEIATVVADSPFGDKYDEAVDRESAFEKLSQRAAAAAEAAERINPGRKRTHSTPRRRGGGRRGQSVGEAFAKSVVRSIGSSAGRALIRGILGSLFKGR
jgi:DNA helicase HerA-like ATPase